MSILDEEKGSPVLIEETMDTFKHLAGPLLALGDLAGVNRLAEKAYIQVMKGIEKGSLEEMRVRQEMGQVLQEVLMQGARKRRRYFETYRDNWRRLK
jgi:hypothetical protein